MCKVIEKDIKSCLNYDNVQFRDKSRNAKIVINFFLSEGKKDSYKLLYVAQRDPSVHLQSISTQLITYGNILV